MASGTVDGIEQCCLLSVYLISFLCMAAVIWISVDLLILYNRECSNPMPQFETHRGGEEHA